MYKHKALAFTQASAFIQIDIVLLFLSGGNINVQKDPICFNVLCLCYDFSS